ncbi:MAG TPA: GlxA family transcriptional regulator [Myxococcota bacterium]|nr:GlxA family transcriptional regulator [Myxococcota bacterium]
MKLVSAKSTDRIRRVALVAYPDAQVLDITGPLEVFANANRRLDELEERRTPRYSIEIVAREAGPLRTMSGIQLVADRALREVRGPIDTLLVAGGEGTRAALRDSELVDFIRRSAPRARRVASICSGTFLLAEAGLLDGRRATTHWASCAALAERYPKVEVETDPIFVRDGKIWSSAGVCAGMDLALALVEQDHGREVALTVAQWMVLFLKRPGGQSQFSVGLAAQATEHERIRELQAWAQAHLGSDLGNARLAKRIAMSPRNFARVFAKEVGETPARWVERARVEAARRMLEESDDGIDAVASRCGFGTAETLRRAFLRQLRVAPSAYRARFRSAAA